MNALSFRACALFCWVMAGAVLGADTGTLSSTNGFLPEPLDDARKLAIGDRVSFRVLEDRDEPRSLMVTDSGEIEVPYIGRVKALNATCRQLAGEIKALLEKDYYYQATVLISVDLLTRARGRVYLAGQVRSPGPQDIPVDEVHTVSRAILKAGGFSDFADKKKVKVSRAAAPPGNEKKTFIIDVTEVWEKGRAEKDLVLQPDDLIFVPQRLINF